jgi:hypothetical protein
VDMLPPLSSGHGEIETVVVLVASC